MTSGRVRKRDAEYRVVPGEIVSGKFRVDEIIGSGAMAIVASATHLGLEDRVALKILRRRYARDPVLRDRFLQEARTAAKLHSPHAARVVDIGEREDGAPYIVMELLTGIDLAAWLDCRGRLSIADSRAFIIEACEALAEAHAQGIVHRDIKPANLFAVEKGKRRTIKVLDFGVSHANLVGPAPVETSTVFGSSVVVGSPAYMSPEQLSGNAVDHRSDIWSLGITLFELLTEIMPFEAERSLGTLITSIIHDAPREIRDYRLDVPSDLADLVSRCLHKDPEERPQSVGELAVELLPFAGRRARDSADHAAFVSREAGLATDDVRVPMSLKPSIPPEFLQVPEHRVVLRSAKPASGYQPIALPEPASTRTSAPVSRDAARTLPPPDDDSLKSVSEPRDDEIEVTVRMRHPTPFAASTSAAGWIGVGGVFVLAMAMTLDRGAPAPAAAPVATDHGLHAPAVRRAQRALVIASDPPGAAVFVGAKRICAHTPCRVLVADDAPIRLERAGYRPTPVDSLRRDGRVDVRLEPLGPPAAKP